MNTEDQIKAYYAKGGTCDVFNHLNIYIGTKTSPDSTELVYDEAKEKLYSAREERKWNKIRKQFKQVLSYYGELKL